MDMKLKRAINQVSAIAKTDFLGVLRNKTAIFFTLLFPLFFIGAFFPLSIMPKAAQIFGEALPFTKLVNAMQDIMTRNLPFDAVIPEILYLAVSGLILFLLGTIAYRISLRRL